MPNYLTLQCKQGSGGLSMTTQEKWLSDLGARLKAEREKQGLTQQILAGKANTKQDYIAQLERGSRSPSLRTFMNILSALDMIYQPTTLYMAQVKNAQRRWMDF
jgi:transcriptional regulator with XRE-family HTH domain